MQQFHVLAVQAPSLLKQAVRVPVFQMSLDSSINAGHVLFRAAGTQQLCAE